MTSPLPDTPTAAPVTSRLDQVVARIRLLRFASGTGRLLWRSGLTVLLVYAADRLLHLPRGARAALLVVLLVALGRELWLRLLRPQLRAPGRLAAARLVEQARPSFEGRLVSALQLPAAGPGSLAQRVHDEAAELCAGRDLRKVLAPKPSLAELLRGLGLLAALALFVSLARPDVAVFLQRWSLQDVAWPRDTVLQLVVPERSAVHVWVPGEGLIAARGGVVQLEASWDGLRPERPELVVDGERGERTTPMMSGVAGRLQGHIVVQTGDRSVFVRGGDDDGSQNRVDLVVIEPPTLDAPVFRLEPPAYLAQAPREVGPEDLVVVEGTRVTVSGLAPGGTVAGELRLLGEGRVVPFALSGEPSAPALSAEFVASKSDTLVIALTGEHGLETPDPSNHALLVREDRPPTLRLFTPARSDVKLSARAAVPLALLAEDDHGVARVGFTLRQGDELLLTQELSELPTHAGQHRFLLDLSTHELAGTLSYDIEVEDARRLGDRGAQVALLEGRRLDIVEEGEVQRLISERQLRLKEAYTNLRERQQRASEAVGDLLALAESEVADADLVAATVAQSQVGNRLDREVRELCSILEEAVLNRLDTGPGAESLLGLYLEELASRPVDKVFAPAAWRELAAAHADGRFGRLDLAGRLLDMAALALQLSEDLAPVALDALTRARGEPDAAALGLAAEAQRRLTDVLDRLIDRMDEWEDYQEVLSLVKSLIDDQKSLRVRTQAVLGEQTRRN